MGDPTFDCSACNASRNNGCQSCGFAGGFYHQEKWYDRACGEHRRPCPEHRPRETPPAVAYIPGDRGRAKTEESLPLAAREYLAMIGRRGGSSRSPRKQAAARLNRLRGSR